MYLWEEADYIALEYQTMEDTLSHGIYTYGLFAAMGAALMMLVMYALMEAKKMPKGATALTGVLSIFFGTGTSISFVGSCSRRCVVFVRYLKKLRRADIFL